MTASKYGTPRPARKGPPAPTPARAPERSPRHRAPGQILALFGLKGGIGRSTIAANLAVGLAQFYGKRVALIDADMWFSAQAVLLNLPTDRSMADLTGVGDHLDAETARHILIPHSSGVLVALGPQDVAHVETLPVDLPARLARIYQALFDYVIVDSHPSLEEYVLQVLDVADRILLCTTPEIGPVRSTRQVLDLAPRLGWEHKLSLVLNRVGDGVDRGQIEEVLGRQVDATIVSAAPQLIGAGLRGSPILMTDLTGEHEVTRDLARLVAMVAGAPAPDWASQGAARRALKGFALPRWLGGRRKARPTDETDTQQIAAARLERANPIEEGHADLPGSTPHAWHATGSVPLPTGGPHAL